MYIFGYGSLINPESRKLTGQTGDAFPAIVNGFDRHWSKVDGSYQISPLVVTSGKGSVNGVLIEIDDHELLEFDKREAGYHCIKVVVSQIESDTVIDASADVWMYVKDETASPCVNAPIMQSYVDTVLAGCLSISSQFAERFVQSTLGWHHPLENDRHQPKYGRIAGVKAHHLSLIDDLIASVRN
ncbi:putative BtrG-like domain protein [Vibrio nigripulchritudo SFn27]|uniref:Putative BtrG-like domain protein n=1 Tax=Vibrio nigripulchritudo TaxID=28173 RepID=U4KD42_9VIBR|nr:gamma-glutamylcyclotransferase family protein [Vibrio nigripulchritudo]CCN83129.1 putative BtrG-like domain protein [Vibrio nigripulchritudo BLFn1]CCN86267.1 putative BtrG-like domain protein [Vibrio nigripulchritudo SFn27]CCN92827.1 putative BtrG-like domain protein [Vibrio nigripulchritudo ENn2]CCO42737.1 putative BtrG-like domain protein [Vibrio nigripulchritudo SFn135]CCO52604.1 putative BtrG-like domain protein [Vibrio nigripulchritudo Wn13]